MVDRSEIEKAVRNYIEGTGIFLVSVKVSSSNKITVLADRKDNITIDDCVDLHRMIEKCLDRDKEDFELQVSSPGLEMPFVVIEQYYKNEGRQITVTDNEGTKFTGTLMNVTNGGFDLEAEVRIKGKKKEKKEIPFNFDQVKAAKVVLTFK